MKKIINGKVYNTESAKKVASWDNSCGVRDFKWYQEALYRKITGEYFIHAEGGPASRARKPSGNNGWTGGEFIEPISIEYAKQWMEEKADFDEYVEEFGEPEE